MKSFNIFKKDRKKKLKPIIPITLYIDDNLYVDMEYLEQYRKNPRSYWDVTGYEGIVLGFGINVFVFDVESCEFFEE